MIELGVVIGLSLVGLFALTRCFFRVEEGHVAVVTVFGAAQRKEGKKHAPEVSCCHKTDPSAMNVNFEGIQFVHLLIAREFNLRRC